MKCQQCGAELEEGVLFCKECGAKVEKKVLFCRECGAKLAEGARFCSGCGADVNALNDAQSSVKKPEVVYVNQTSQSTYEHTSINEPKGYTNYQSTSRYTNTKNKTFSETIKDMIGANKLVAGIVVLGLIVLVMIIIGSSKRAKTEDDYTSNISIPTIAGELGSYKIEAGTQYAYMSDDWNVYIAEAISDSVVKIEHWYKGDRSKKELEYRSDIGTYKINDESSGFAWVDVDHTAFVITFQDSGNSRVKKAKPHVFTINISESNVYKGTDYDSTIACYTYNCDKWHMYRAIPLTDSLIKIECWSRGSTDDDFNFGWDWCVINWTNTDTDFTWTDDKHKGFTITTRDLQNKSYWKDETLVAFMLENEGYVYSSVKSYLDKNPSASGTNVQERAQKNGYDEKNNTLAQVGKFYFSIPSYWVSDINEADHYRAYAETSGKTAMLEITATVDNDDPVTYDILKKENDEGLMAASFETWFEKCEGTTSEAYDNGRVKGFIYKTNFAQGSYEGESTALCFPSESDNKWFFVTLTITNNTTYKYDNDFGKILSSITSETVEKKDDSVKNESNDKADNSQKTEEKKDEKKDDNKIPAMSGTTLKSTVDKLKELGVTEVYDEDFGHGTRQKALSDSAGGLMIDIIYVTETKEIMCATVVTNKLASAKEQKAFVKAIAEYVCPSDDASTISSWVNSNVGKTAEKELNGFTYQLSLGPVDNILFSAGELEWETWELSH